jgi:hypothetical protein
VNQRFGQKDVTVDADADGGEEENKVQVVAELPEKMAETPPSSFVDGSQLARLEASVLQLKAETKASFAKLEHQMAEVQEKLKKE